MEHASFPQFQANSEDSQIVGRRTPLGAVGLGGFYFQGPNTGGHGISSDENNPDPGCSSQSNSRLVLFLFQILFS